MYYARARRNHIYVLTPAAAVGCVDGAAAAAVAGRRVRSRVGARRIGAAPPWRRRARAAAHARPPRGTSLRVRTGAPRSGPRDDDRCVRFRRRLARARARLTQPSGPHEPHGLRHRGWWVCINACVCVRRRRRHIRTRAVREHTAATPLHRSLAGSRSRPFTAPGSRGRQSAYLP